MGGTSLGVASTQCRTCKIEEDPESSLPREVTSSSGLERHLQILGISLLHVDSVTEHLHGMEPKRWVLRSLM